MKKTVIALFAALSVTVAATSVFAVDNSKEPAGFRGIKWDTPITDYPNTFRPVKDFFLENVLSAMGTDLCEKTYEKIKEKKSFAGHKVDRVFYCFDSVGFVAAGVYVMDVRGMGLPIYNDFVKACNLQWGRGEEIEDPDGAKIYRWLFPGSAAAATYASERVDEIFLFVVSVVGIERAEERKKKRMNSESKTDF